MAIHIREFLGINDETGMEANLEVKKRIKQLPAISAGSFSVSVYRTQRQSYQWTQVCPSTVIRSLSGRSSDHFFP